LEKGRETKLTKRKKRTVEKRFIFRDLRIINFVKVKLKQKQKATSLAYSGEEMIYIQVTDGVYI
jgi:hypothetical protein